VTAEPEKAGLAAGFGAYLLWGLFPLYFLMTADAAPVEVIAHRVVWSLLLCLAILLVTRRLTLWVHMLTDWRAVGILTIASFLLAANWLTFVAGVTTGHTVDVALGYYINPLVTVGLAVVVLRERLRTAQWVAISLGAAAVIVITVGYGAVPWIGLTLAVTFAGYGLLKKHIGTTVDAVAGLTTETLALFPVALTYLVWLGTHGQATFGRSTSIDLLLIGLGAVTTVPLLGFNAAARRLPLSVIGLLQYLTPTMHLLIGVLVQHEQMPAARWWGFALVGVAVCVMAVDGVVTARAPRTNDPSPVSEP
jgi:chloramphenicol-sensitive protein RarD